MMISHIPKVVFENSLHRSECPILRYPALRFWEHSTTTPQKIAPCLPLSGASSPAQAVFKHALAIVCGSLCDFCLKKGDANTVIENVAGKEYKGDSKKEIHKRGNY